MMTLRWLLGFFFPLSLQLQDMNNYLTVPAAPPDSPTMCRSRLASGKRTHTHTRTLSHSLSHPSHIVRLKRQKHKQLQEERRHSGPQKQRHVFPPHQHKCVAVAAAAAASASAFNQAVVFIVGRENDYKPARRRKAKSVFAGKVASGAERESHCAAAMLTCLHHSHSLITNVEGDANGLGM